MKKSLRNYGLFKSHTEKSFDELFLEPLPRAVLRPNAFILLDGEWSFEIDADDLGLQEQWFKGHTYHHTAVWPGSVEQHMARAKGESEQSWTDKVVAWYERHFPLPEMERQDAPTLIQLTFGACGYETMVWLNGHLLTTIEGEKVHVGEYTSFSYELDSALLRENNRLTVRIADTMDANIPRGKQESSVYKRGGIWYQTFTGGVRSVWLEIVERNRLRSRLGVVSIVEDKMVRFNIAIRIKDPGKYVIKLQVFDRNDDERHPIAEGDYPIELQEGQKRQRLVLEVEDAKLWSPSNPVLYRLVAKLIDERGHTSEIETMFGLRKIEARGCCIYLNNKPLYLDGILYQPGTSDYEQISKHMYAMKRLGCNLVRIHIAGVDPRIYRLADSIGMLLWVEVPSPHSSNATSRLNHKAELVRMLDLIETHPSIAVWSLYNEDWGAQDIETNAETREYIINLYHYMKIHHPQFLVIDNDGWRHISVEGKLVTDALTAHIYTPDIDVWRATLDKVARGELTGVTAFPLVIGDPFFYMQQLPFIVSEWGGFGFINYGGPKGAEGRAELIKKYKEELRKHDIAGDVYTQATNIEDEKNGLIDQLTGELMVPEGLLYSRAKKERRNRHMFDHFDQPKNQIDT